MAHSWFTVLKDGDVPVRYIKLPEGIGIGLLGFDGDLMVPSGK